MAKIRVYQFAKLLKITNDEAVELLRKGGFDVKSNLSSIGEERVEKFRTKTPRPEEAPAAAGVTSAPKSSAPLKSDARAAIKRPATPKAKPADPAARKPGPAAPARAAGQPAPTAGRIA